MKVRSMLFSAVAVMSLVASAHAVRADETAFDEGYFTIKNVIVTESAVETTPMNRRFVVPSIPAPVQVPTPPTLPTPGPAPREIGRAHV